MGDQLITGLVTIATAIVGLAVFAVLVSKNAQTPQVITAAGNALGSDITAAVAPVAGGLGGSWSAIPGNGL